MVVFYYLCMIVFACKELQNTLFDVFFENF